MTIHADITGGDNHTPITFVFADDAERNSAINPNTGNAYLASDIGKQAWQTDNDGFWALKDVTPTWAEISSSGGVVDSIVAGTNITVDNADPKNPIVSSTSGGGGSPGGSDTEIQFNENGAFGGLEFITTDGTDLLFANSTKASFGTAAGLTIQHTNAEGQIKNSLGAFSIINTSGEDLTFTSGNADLKFKLGSVDDSTALRVSDGASADLFTVGGSGLVTIENSLNVGEDIGVKGKIEILDGSEVDLLIEGRTISVAPTTDGYSPLSLTNNSDGDIRLTTTGDSSHTIIGLGGYNTASSTFQVRDGIGQDILVINALHDAAFSRDVEVKRNLYADKIGVNVDNEPSATLQIIGELDNLSSGTIDTVSGNTLLAGVGTNFVADLVPGQHIKVNGDVFVIDVISGVEILFVTIAPEFTGFGFDFFVGSAMLNISNGEAAHFAINENGGISVGSANTADSAIFQIDSTNRGFALPRMTETQRNDISSPLHGLEIYNLTSNKPEHYDGSSWTSVGTAPAGNNLEIQFNNNGNFGSSQEITVISDSLNISTDSALTLGDYNDGAVIGNNGVETFFLSQKGDMHFALFDPGKDLAVLASPNGGAMNIVSSGSSQEHSSSALLNITSTTQGLLIPRLTTIQRDAISNPADGLEIYNIDTNSPEFFDSTTTWQTRRVIKEELASAFGDWSIQTSADDEEWQAIAFGAGVFVAVSSSGSNRIMTSTDGVNWVAVVAPQLSDWTDVKYANGIFMSVSSDGLVNTMTSTDGTNWTLRPDAVQDARDPYKIAFGSDGLGQDVWISVPKTTGPPSLCHISTDNGVSWVQQAMGISGAYENITFGNGVFIAVGSNGIVRSVDYGATWTRDSTPAGIGGLGWSAVAFGNGSFVAVNNDALGSQGIIYSTDLGVSWVDTSFSLSAEWGGISYGNGIFTTVATDFSSGFRSATSSDFGVNWDAVSTPADNSWAGITFGNNEFVSVSKTGTGDRVMTALMVGANSAVFELQSTTSGFLPPRMTSAQRDLIPNPIEGLIIYNTNIISLQIYNGSTWAGVGANSEPYQDNIFVSEDENIVDRLIVQGVSTEVHLGPVATSANGDISLAADGTMTINRDGWYVFSITVNIGTTGTTAKGAWLRVVHNTTQVGTSLHVQGAGTRSHSVGESFTIDCVAGDTVEAQVTSNNSNVFLRRGLAGAPGWNDSPHASIIVQRGKMF